MQPYKNLRAVYQLVVTTTLGSMVIWGCKPDCDALGTSEGERLKVTVTKVERLCSSQPLVVGDYFMLDMLKEYEFSETACTYRSAQLSQIADSYSGIVESCDARSSYNTPIFSNCVGPVSAGTCRVGAVLSFPEPPSRDEISSEDVLLVHWVTYCGDTDCPEGNIDQYLVKMERVGMGWVPQVK